MSEIELTERFSMSRRSPKQSPAKVDEQEAQLRAIKILSESTYGRMMAESYGIDRFVSEVISQLTNNAASNDYYDCFGVDDCFEVLRQAIDRIDKYDGTPSTLHLYLGNDNPFFPALKVQNGRLLDETQIRFVFLQVLRWFSEFPNSITYENRLGSMDSEWNDAFACCNGSQDDPHSILGRGSERNLTRLMHPIVEEGDFDYFKRILRLLPDNTTKLKWAIEILADYEQTIGYEADTFRDEYGVERYGYAKNIRIEIKKLKKLAKLEKAKTDAKGATAVLPRGSNDDGTSEPNDDVCVTCGKGNRFKDRNLERTVLLMSVLFDSVGVRADVTDQIDAIRIITGYSDKTIKPLMYKNGTNPEKGVNLPNAYRKDFVFVADLFEKLGRSDLAEKTRAKE